MPNETGKERWARIEQDYYRNDKVVRRRGLLGLVAMLVALGWLVLAPRLDAKRQPRVRLFEQTSLASPGPLARTHATWETECQACHLEFQSMSGETVSPVRWLSWGNRAERSDAQCQRCHAGPDHHGNQVAEDVPSCASCHRDHRGGDVDLKRSDDRQCTGCHGALKTVPGSKSLEVTQSVTLFDLDRRHHPEFSAIVKHTRKEAGDPGKLKFNHAQHLTRGIPLLSDGKEKALWTYAQLSEPNRRRYGWRPGEPLDGGVQLDCVHCHQADGEQSEPNQSQAVAHGLPPRTSGAYMMPITYENQCRACHPLRFGSPNSPSEVRHGLTPSEVQSELRRFYVSDAVKDDPELLHRFVPKRPLPGKPADERIERVGQAVTQKVLSGLKMLFGSGTNGCIKCHVPSKSPVPLVHPGEIADLAIEPVKVPRVWFEKARFDHSAHRAVKCQECHEQANASKVNADVLVPGIETCLKCHGPVRTENGQARGGAGSNCTECHRYHHGDQPLEGPGSSSRGVETRLSIDDFISSGVAVEARGGK
jgi:hypothetical protein